VTLERDVHVEMFHGDEVNEEAVLFANWAYKSLHDAIIRCATRWRSARLLAAEPALCRRDPGPDAGGRDHVDRGLFDGHLLQGLGDPARAALVHLPVPPELMADIRDIGGRSAPATTR